MGPFKPTRQAKPVAGQPLDSNSVKTDEAVPRGAMVLRSETNQRLCIMFCAFVGVGPNIHTKAR